MGFDDEQATRKDHLDDAVTEGGKIKLPGSLGFREGTTSVHTSRTMMLSELSLVLEHVAADAKADDTWPPIVEENILGKPTQTTRRRTARRLAELYALDPASPVFRLLRHFWAADATARPMLAFLAAAARDPLLREMTPFVVAIPVGSAVTPAQVAEHLEEKYPARFKPDHAALHGPELASSWTPGRVSSTGKVNKKRSQPVVTPVVATFALLLGFLCGLRGKLLLDSPWTRMLDRTPAEVADLAAEASEQGWLTYKAAGSVVEITFPGLLTPQEEKASHDPD